MSETSVEDLTITGTSLLEEVDEQMIAAAKEAFAGQNVQVDHYFNDFSPENIESLKDRALRATQVLFDFMKTTPQIDAGRRASHARIQGEDDTFGFYVVYTNMRDDKGVQRRYNCYRAIEILRRRFSSFNLSLTVDSNGGTTLTSLRPLDIEQVRQIPYVAAYQVLWTIDVKRDLKWQPVQMSPTPS